MKYHKGPILLFSQELGYQQGKSDIQERGSDQWTEKPLLVTASHNTLSYQRGSTRFPEPSKKEKGTHSREKGGVTFLGGPAIQSGLSPLVIQDGGGHSLGGKLTFRGLVLEVSQNSDWGGGT